MPASAATKKPRRLPRFSLRTLILFVVLAGSGYGLRQSFNRVPWGRGPVLAGHSNAVNHTVNKFSSLTEITENDTFSICSFRSRT